MRNNKSFLLETIQNIRTESSVRTLLCNSPGGIFAINEILPFENCTVVILDKNKIHGELPISLKISDAK